VLGSFLFCVLVSATASGLTGRETELESFRVFSGRYGKLYSNDLETQHAFSNFQANLGRIAQLNERAGRVSKSKDAAVYGITKFADLSPEEFKQQYLLSGLSQRKQDSRAPFSVLDTKIVELPTEFDWRSKGAVTPVKNQGQCGSCWAFSTSEAIESQWFLHGNPLTELSIQQIVDCDVGRNDSGCNGGDTVTAYEYVIAAGGLETEQAYPYTAENGQCVFSKNSVVAHISNWTYVTTTKNETQMQVGLVARGPLSICVEAETWQFYIGGVVTDLCGQNLDHCVAITGFQPYTTWYGETYQVWNIRNSWGADWGESGYIYVERGFDLCGVADEVTLPII